MLARTPLLAVLALAFAPAALAQGYYAYWTCGTSKQCSQISGGSSGRTGPFATESDCKAWFQKYYPGDRNKPCKLEGAGGGAAASSGPETPEQAAVSAAQRVMNAGNFSTPQNSALTMGAGIATGLFVGMMQSSMQGPSPQELQRRAAARQEQLRQQQAAEEQRRLAEERRYNSLVANLRGVETRPGGLTLKRDGPTQEAAAAPFGLGSVPPSQAATGPGGNLGLLKLGDAPPAPATSALQQLANLNAEGATPGVRSGFDSASTSPGGLPPAPPTPEGRPVGGLTLEDLARPGPKPRAEVARVLGEALETRRRETDAVKQEITKLEQAPVRDDAALRLQRENLERIEREQKALEDKKKRVDEAKEEMVDLSIGEAEVRTEAK